jgi:hypothetical protein
MYALAPRGINRLLRKTATHFSFGVDMVNRALVGYVLFSFLLLSILYVAAQAQISLDGSLGQSGVLTGPTYTIPARLGQQHGGNLFHSFGAFNVHTGERAIFMGPDSVTNIRHYPKQLRHDITLQADHEVWF